MIKSKNNRFSSLWIYKDRELGLIHLKLSQENLNLTERYLQLYKTLSYFLLDNGLQEEDALSLQPRLNWTTTTEGSKGPSTFNRSSFKNKELSLSIKNQILEKFEPNLLTV